jgi:hypothetical protein
LSPPYPNPFGHSTTLDLDVESPDVFRLAVFDALGRRVLTLFDGRLPVGRHRVSFEANGLPSGVYYVYLRSEAGLRETRAVTLLR